MKSGLASVATPWRPVSLASATRPGSTAGPGLPS